MRPIRLYGLAMVVALAAAVVPGRPAAALADPVDNRPPSAPGTPVVTEITYTGATMTWAPATDDRGVITGYDIWRRTPDRGDLLHNDYAFVVVAEDPAGNRSEPSGVVRLRAPADPAASCRLAFAGPSPWFPGQYRVAVTYTGTTAVMHWSVRFTLPAGTTVTQSWSAGWEQSGDQVTFRYEGWADVLTVGETINLDMALARPGLPDPASLRLNGAACAPA